MLKNNILILTLLIFASCAQIQERRKDKKEPVEEVKSPEKQKAKDIAVIFGPGGMKTFAQIGAMQALDEKNLKIKKVVGLEWGAAVAAIYARKAKVHDLEWQMSKLNEQNLPKTGFFKNDIDLENPNRLNLFFEKVFQDHNLANNEIPFSCPTKTFRMTSPSWLKAGPAYRELKKCIAYPPLFYSYKSWHADALAVREAIKEIRSSGDYSIIFIDVLYNDDFSSSQKILNQEAEKILWQEVVQSLNEAKEMVDYSISIDTSSYNILDVEKKRELIKLGKEKALDTASQIAEEQNGSL